MKWEDKPPGATIGSRPAGIAMQGEKGDLLTSLLTPPFVPFAVAAAILAGLLLIELAMLLIGGSLFADAGAPEVELGAPDLDLPEIEALELSEIDVAGLEVEDIGPSAEPNPGWTGFGTVPFLVWFAALLAGFSVIGLALQMVGPFPLWLAVPLAALTGIGFARTFARIFARVVPQTESAAQNPRQLARRRGVVTQGTSRRGRRAEIRVADRYGNTHYIRVEPLRDADEIGRGCSVLTVWDHRTAALRIVALD